MKFAVRLIKNAFHPLKVPEGVNLKQNQMIIVRTDRGEEALSVFIVNSEIMAQWQKFKPEALCVVRVMNDKDLEVYNEQKELEVRALLKCREFAKARKLVMSLTRASYTFDRRKITFYYTAPERVDFRELLKDLTAEFRHVRIDLRHIGVRDETALLQGHGLCGQKYCCCTFLKKFDFVSTKLAKDQNIPLTSGKITGACGRLLCCLNYEYSNYIEIAKMLPPVGSGIMTPDGVAKVASICFLQQKVCAKLEDGKIKQYSKDDIEMLDQEVNIEIEHNGEILNYSESDENIDIKNLDNDKNSSTGNI
ncbi:MAG: stage 0 sporulation protein [Candidatus Gastranaerophilales bacterium]|nr:stage 0 sporulation protein [Candidatus Gastranaerophilales bacterium]